MACNGLKMGPFHLFVHPQMVSDHFWKNTFLTQFYSPFSRHFVTLEGQNWLAMGSKWDHFICSGTPNGLGSFWKNTFLTDF